MMHEYSPIEIANWMMVMFIIGLIGGAILSGGWKINRRRRNDRTQSE